MENKELKYQYHLLTWGGFYNDHHKHSYKPGDYLFDTKEEREQYIEELEKTSKELNAHVLMISRTEGFNCDIRAVCHRVIRYKGQLYKSEYDMGINYPFRGAQYTMNYKWTLGFNDYPLGEDFDYDNGEVEIISEYITGAFDIEED